MTRTLRHLASIALLAVTIGAAGCELDYVWIALLGDSYSDPEPEPRHDWLPYAPRKWRFNDLATSGQKCWEIVPFALNQIHLNKGKVMVIFCGTNDAGREDWDLAVTAGWIQAAIDDATSKGRIAVAVTPPPAFREYPVTSEVRNARLEALRDEIYAIASLYGAEVADLWDATLQHPDPESLYVDGLHFGPAGRLMTAQVIEAAVARAN